MKYTIDMLGTLMSTNILIVGRPKTGKTFSCATLHKLKNRSWLKGSKLLFFDFDEGVQPLIRLAKAQGWTNELDIRRYNSPEGDKVSDKAERNRVTTMFHDFITELSEVHDMVGANKEWRPDTLDRAPYAVVVDSLTAIMDDILDYTLGNRSKQLGMANVDGRAEYGLQMGKIVETIRSVRSLPCLSVWLAHEQTKAETVKMPSAPKGTDAFRPVTTGKTWRLPYVTGQLAQSIGGEFGAVLYTDIEAETSDKFRYIWYTRPIDNIYGAGTRLRDNLDTKVPQDFNVVIE